MKKAVIIREFRLNVECPYCGAEINLLHESFDGKYSDMVDGRNYSNETIECTNRTCGKEFGIDTIDNY